MLKPCGHRLIIRQDALEDAHEDIRKAKQLGLIIPEGERDKANIDRGVVLSVGPTAFKDFGGEAWCKVGDRVFFARYGGKMINLNEDTTKEEDWVVVLNDEDIQAVITEE